MSDTYKSVLLQDPEAPSTKWLPQTTGDQVMLADGSTLEEFLGQLAAVATSGDYDDLENKPTIPAAQIQSDWNQTNNQSKDFIKHKPTIPTKTSDLTNDSGFVGFGDIQRILRTLIPNQDEPSLTTLQDFFYSHYYWNKFGFNHLFLCPDGDNFSPDYSDTSFLTYVVDPFECVDNAHGIQMDNEYQAKFVFDYSAFTNVRLFICDVNNIMGYDDPTQNDDFFKHMIIGNGKYNAEQLSGHNGLMLEFSNKLVYPSSTGYTLYHSCVDIKFTYFANDDKWLFC